MMGIEFGKYSLVDKTSEISIYKNIDIQYGNVSYFYIDRKDDDIELSRMTISNMYKVNKADCRNETKMSFYAKRVLKHNKLAKEFYDIYSGILFYPGAMAVFQQYYDQVTKIEDKQYIMKILGLCGVDVAIAILCTMFKDQDALLKEYIKINFAMRVTISNTICLDDISSANLHYPEIIKEGYRFNKQKYGELLNALTDKQIISLFNLITVIDKKIYSSRKLLKDMIESNEMNQKIAFCYAYRCLGEEKFYSIIEYEKKKPKKAK